MPDEFPCDVFFSHSAKDKAVVRPLAERLRADGGKVSGFGFRIYTVLPVGPCVRLGLGAVGVRHVPLSRPAEQGAPLAFPCGSTTLLSMEPRHNF